MSRIDSYSVYQSSYYENNTAKSKKTKETDKTDKTSKTDKNSQVQLSDRAKKLLEELKKTYGNMDFIVADYESDEEAAQYLSRGTKEYSVLIEPELLEEMAADAETKEKYLGILDEATGKLADMKTQLGDKADEVTRLGVTIGKDGMMTFFAELEKVSERQKERIEKAKEEKAENKAVSEKKKDDKTVSEKETEEIKNSKTISEKSKKTTVYASSVEELLEKIQNVDWSQVKAAEVPVTGSKFDCTI